MGLTHGFELVPLHYPFNRPSAIRITQDHIQSDERIELCNSYIKAHGIDQAEIVTDRLTFLNRLSTLKHLRIIPHTTTEVGFDFSPLYEMPEIRSLTARNVYGLRSERSSVLDYSQINGLVELFVRVNKKTLNYNNIKSLRSLRITGFKGKERDLTDMFCSEELDTLEMIQCGVLSLNGMGISKKMQCVYLYNNRALSDISALVEVKKTVRALRISNCSSIGDFSVLSELENLELLELTGSNTLPSLDFIKEMKSLKTLIFNMVVQDGDLSPCLELSYASTSRNCRHYNLPISSLPKKQYYRGNDDIELWRRLE